MVKTNHKYIKQYHVKETDTALILGTIHPHDIGNFKIDYFYGNRNSIWTILSSAFPQFDFNTKDSIINALSNSKIWISDMIASCERLNEKVTQDKLLQKIELNDVQIRDGIKNSNISKIFFTSRFAAKLFCDKFSINHELDSKRQFQISEGVFGRKITGIVLFSPSGQANIGISKNKMYLEQIDHYQNLNKPVNQFKIDFYRSAFENQFVSSK